MTTEHQRLTARYEWITRFEKEFDRVSGYPHDPESGTAATLHPLMGHRPPEEAAREYFQALESPDDWAASPQCQLTDLAVSHGLIEPGAPLSPALRDFAFSVGELCAFIGDRYRDPKAGCAGDAIRARYGRVPF